MSGHRQKIENGRMMDASDQEKIGGALAGESGKAGVDILDLRYGLEDRLSPVPSLLFGFQHVLVMFTAMIVSPLVIGQLLNLPSETRITMVAGVMLGCGVGTVVSALGVGYVGSRLPLLLGAYAVYIGPVVAIAKVSGLTAATTALLIGGIILFVISPFLAKLRILFPPVVVGTLLLVTGETLIKIGVNVASGVNTPFAGNPIAPVLAVVSIMLILVINRLTKGVVRALSVFIALVCLYLIAVAMGFANFQAIQNAPWFRLPTLLPYGWLTWPGFGGLTTIMVYYLVSAIYTLSITIALCKMLGVETTDARVGGAIAGDGLGSIIASAFGGVPLISYDQNVGVISLTGVGSRYVVAVAGGILIGMAFLPKIAALVAIVPPFVLGGTLIFMFGMIAAVGIGILADSLKSHRDLLLLAATVGLSTAVNFAPPSLFKAVPELLRILTADGIVVGTVTAVLLNIVLPKEN